LGGIVRKYYNIETLNGMNKIEINNIAIVNIPLEGI
jgi:hypothetical protein